MIAVCLTDHEWFAFLRDGPAWAEVNFWTPTPWRVRILAPGDRFYFLLKQPVRKVAGHGVFAAYEELPASEAWDRFGRANGVPDLAALVAKTGGYAARRSTRAGHSDDPTLGCLVLREPVFLDEARFRAPEALGAPVPPKIVKFKTFPELVRLDLEEEGAALTAPFALVEPGGRRRKPAAVVDWPGQRRFRDRVLRAYGFVCALTGKRARRCSRRPTCSRTSTSGATTSATGSPSGRTYTPSSTPA